MTFLLMSLPLYDGILTVWLNPLPPLLRRHMIFEWIHYVFSLLLLLISFSINTILQIKDISLHDCILFVGINWQKKASSYDCYGQISVITIVAAATSAAGPHFTNVSPMVEQFFTFCCFKLNCFLHST